MKTEYFLKGQTGTVVLKEPRSCQYEDTFYPAVEFLRGIIEVWSDIPGSALRAVRPPFAALILVADGHRSLAIVLTIETFCWERHCSWQDVAVVPKKRAARAFRPLK